MASKISGFNALDNKLEALGNVGKTIGKKAVREGMKPILNQMRKDAPKDTGKGAKALKVTVVKSYRTGTTVARAGIDKSNWEKAKHLYFQHYGYENRGLNFDGEIVATNIGWMNKTFEKSKKEGADVMNTVIEMELSKIIG